MSDIENLRSKLDAAIAQFQLSTKSNQDNITNVSKLLTTHIEALLKRYKKEIVNNENHLEEVIKSKYIQGIYKNMNNFKKSIFEDISKFQNFVQRRDQLTDNDIFKRHRCVITTLLRAFGNFIDSEEAYLCEIDRVKNSSTLTYLSTETFSSVNTPKAAESISSIHSSPNEVPDSVLKRNLNIEVNKRNIRNKEEMENKLLKMKSDIQKEEQGHRLNLTSMHDLKERIHLCLKKLALIKLQLTEELISQYKGVTDAKNTLEYQNMTDKHQITLLAEKERVSHLLLRLHKNINNLVYDSYDGRGKQRVNSLMLDFQRIIVKNKERVIDYILGEVQFILGQGTLENDLRFLEKLEKQSNDIDKFDTPRFFKICVQIGIAKKYVKDIIYLKKKTLFKTYYNLK